MDFLIVILTSLLSVVSLFILAKIMGNRQVAQLTMFEYIVGITIGSIAAEMATEQFSDILIPLIAMVVYALSTFLLSILTSKFIKLRRFLTGETLILLDDGKLYKGNMKKAKLDLSEMLYQLRDKGFFNIADVQTVIFEPNGKLSILSKSDKRPIQPCDVGMQPEQEKLVVNIVLDGKILNDNLKFTGNDEKWLKKQLRAQDVNSVEEVFLASCDSNNILTVFKKIDQQLTRDMFE